MREEREREREKERARECVCVYTNSVSIVSSMQYDWFKCMRYNDANHVPEVMLQ